MPYYQTPTDPVEAARQAQEALIQQAIEARRRQQVEAQRAQQQNNGILVGGMKGMDALTGGSSAVNPAAEATEASQAAYGGNAAVSGVSETPVAAAPSPLGIAAGAYTGYQQGKGIQSAVKGQDMSTQQQAALALPTFGASLVYNPVKSLWDKNAWQTEGKRVGALKAKGVDVPEALQGATQLKKGRSKEELLNRNAPEDFVGYDQTGTFTNNKFSQSRDEADLTPEDIWGYSTFMEKFGNDWLQKFSEDQRYAIAQKALETGAVSEHKGTVDVDWNNKDLNDFITGVTSGSVKVDSYKKNRPGISQMDAVTGSATTPDDDLASKKKLFLDQQNAFNNALSSSLKASKDQAAANAKASKQSQMARFAIDNSQKGVPGVQSSGTVKTGVQNLDAILDGVLR